MSCKHAQLRSIFLIIAMFNAILLKVFRGVAVTIWFSSISNLDQITKLKNSISPRKNIESNFLPISMPLYTGCPS